MSFRKKQQFFSFKFENTVVKTEQFRGMSSSRINKPSPLENKTIKETLLEKFSTSLTIIENKNRL